MNAPRRRKKPGPPDAAQDRRRPSALAATSLALAAFALGIVGWLAASGPMERPDRAPAVTFKIAPPSPGGMPASVEGAAAASAGPGDATATMPPGAGPPTAAEALPANSEAPTAEAAGPGPGAETAGTAHGAISVESTGPVSPFGSEGGASLPAVETALVERTRLGPLPGVAPDGRRPWRAYARPFAEDKRRPPIAVIVASLGLSSEATEAAIRRLPGTVTLSFAPYAGDLARWVGLARAHGHEVMLDLPMEPVTFPHDYLRSHALLTSLSEEGNLDRLRWLLGRATGYVGMVNQMGSRFTTSEPHVRPILSELQRRGLLFVDSRASPDSVAARLAWEIGLPRAVNNRFIDAEPSREAIDARLHELERIAGDSGRALGIGSPFAVTIDRLAHWAAGLGTRGRTLAPVSALVEAEGN